MNIDVEIRWLIRRDMVDVLDIERACFADFPWTEEEFLLCLRQRNSIGMVAEIDFRVVGFMVYELHKRELRVLNFAVAPDLQRQGVGTTLVNRLKDKLTLQRRNQLRLVVRESNLAACQFFGSQGFIAGDILRKHYDDTDEDGYEFTFHQKWAAADAALL